MIIDAHIHLGSWKNLFEGISVTYEELDTMLDDEGMFGAVITSTDRRNNDYLLEAVEKGSKKYFPIPWIYDDKNCLEWIDKNRDKIYGIKVHQSVERLRVNSKEVLPFLKWAYDNNKIVVVHCGRWQEYASYKYVVEAAEKFKRLPFIFSHMGGAHYPLALDAINVVKERNLKNVFMGIEGLMEHWVVKHGIEVLGAERIIFGSDYPLSHPRMFIAMLQAIKLDPRDMERIVYFNIAELLGI